MKNKIKVLYVHWGLYRNTITITERITLSICHLPLCALHRPRITYRAYLSGCVCLSCPTLRQVKSPGKSRQMSKLSNNKSWLLFICTNYRKKCHVHPKLKYQQIVFAQYSEYMGSSNQKPYGMALYWGKWSLTCRMLGAYSIGAPIGAGQRSRQNHYYHLT